MLQDMNFRAEYIMKPEVFGKTGIVGARESHLAKERDNAVRSRPCPNGERGKPVQVQSRRGVLRPLLSPSFRQRTWCAAGTDFSITGSERPNRGPRYPLVNRHEQK